MNNETKLQLSKIKEKGFLRQKNEDLFSVRVISYDNMFTYEQMNKLASLSHKYGSGKIAITTYQSIEIPDIKSEYIDTVRKEISSMNLHININNKKLSYIITCRGSICINGIIDTYALTSKLYEENYSKTLPNKVKIGISGCPNNCVVSNQYDIGVIATSPIKINEENCKLCSTCTKICKKKALEIKDKLILNNELCKDCGKCLKACKFDAISIDNEGLTIYLGGKSGKKQNLGTALNKKFKLEEIPKVISKILDFYSENALENEKFNETIERVGTDYLLKQYL